MKEAFDCGQQGCHELKAQCVEEIIWLFEKGQEHPWVVMTALDLCKLPNSSKIYHSLFGNGTVRLQNGEKYVQFDGFRMELKEEDWPWTEKIQVIY
jgi:hypothetical protein